MGTQNHGSNSPFSREFPTLPPLGTSRKQFQGDEGTILPPLAQLTLNHPDPESPWPYHPTYVNRPAPSRVGIPITDLVNKDMQQLFGSEDQQISSRSEPKEGATEIPPNLDPSEQNYGHQDLYSTTPMDWQLQSSSLNGTNSLLISGADESSEPLPAPTALNFSQLSEMSKYVIYWATNGNGTGDWTGTFSTDVNPNHDSGPSSNTPYPEFRISTNSHPTSKRFKVWKDLTPLPAGFGADFENSHSRWETSVGSSTEAIRSRGFCSTVLPPPGLKLPPIQQPPPGFHNRPALNIMQARQRGVMLPPLPEFQNGPWGSGESSGHQYSQNVGKKRNLGVIGDGRKSGAQTGGLGEKSDLGVIGDGRRRNVVA